MKILSNVKILIIVFITNYFSISYGYSFTKSLDYYGFTEKKQKYAFQDLLQKASIIPADKALKQIFSPKANNEEIILDIIDILKQTQQKFTARSGNQERWQAKPLEWINYNEKNKFWQI